MTCEDCRHFSFAPHNSPLVTSNPLAPTCGVTRSIVFNHLSPDAETVCPDFVAVCPTVVRK